MRNRGVSCPMEEMQGRVEGGFVPVGGPTLQ